MIRTVCAAVLLTAATLHTTAVQATTVPATTVPATTDGGCARITAPPPESAPPTSVNTLRQAYECVLDNYYSGPVLDSKVLLRDALAAYTQELMRRGADKAGLRLPALTGNRDADWAAFAGMIGTGDPAALRAAITGMVTGLHDDHARVERIAPPSEDGPVGTGIAGLSAAQGPRLDPAARPPLFVTRVLPGSPADTAGIRPGDIIQKVDGIPAFIGDKVNQSLVDAFASATVRLTLKRPTTGRVRTVQLTEGPLEEQEPAVTSKTLPGGVTYVKVPGFFQGAADQVIAKLKGASKAAVVDLRGNGGGSPQEVNRLLGAFAHGKVTGYFCPLTGECTANRTDDSVPLLGLRLVVLTDRACASACEHFSAAVKDNGLGALVGTRTAGAVSGPAEAYLLDDNSVLLLPRVRHLGPAREIIDTVGVPADHHAPMTALDLATGRDPGLAKALGLL
ncbi:S41 family peptidase [Microbispora bryophytorum]|uniref:S41 family peptidase n=1 Tax=Microbispora bryophytorum TaxID=1460882 RepID=UPI001157E3B7|nr:S41 family peptidase [Microbispora bryophytorum]MBD3141315.1 PDZ domain-containing protein [Microbispora bryophytorum]TQR99153.1 PDZ domain-containing protein [Microbispora bryophytorum]